MEVQIKELVGFPGYTIDTNGCVRNKFGKLMTQHISEKGYYRVTLCKSKYQPCSISVHRLVAITFIPNPENKPTVDHIDRNRLNNCVSNLRWATQVEQQQNKSYGEKKIEGQTKEVGIRFHKNVWEAMVCYNNKRHYKYFSSLEEAKKWRDETKQQFVQLALGKLV